MDLDAPGLADDDEALICHALDYAPGAETPDGDPQLAALYPLVPCHASSTRSS